MFFGQGQFPKEFAEMFEKMFVEKINETIRNPEFIANFGGMVGSGLEGKKNFDDAARDYLEKMHLPSRNDLAKVLQYLQQIESRLIAVEEKIEDLADSFRKPKNTSPPEEKPTLVKKALPKKKVSKSGKGK